LEYLKLDLKPLYYFLR